MPSTFSMLGTIKCSTCQKELTIEEMGDHICAPQKPEEPIFAPKKPAGAKAVPPPINPDVANRRYIDRNDSPRTSSSLSGSQDVSPVTPGDDQPLKEPLKAETPNVQEKRQSDPPQNSATSSIYTDNLTDAATTPISAQHLYAPPANDAMYAPVSPTTTGPSNLMAKLTAIAPGPFALTSSKAPTQPSSYGERPPSRKDSIASNGSVNTVQQGSPKAELKRQPSERTRIREEAARKLSGASAKPERDVEKRASSNSTGRRPSTAGSEKSTRSKRSQSSGSDTSGSRAYESVSLNTAKKPEAIVEEAKLSPAEPEKPMPSPTYMAYRPAQPPQRLPRSPTFPHRPTTPQPGPAFGGRPPPPMGGPGQRVGLPSSPAQNRQNNPNNGQQPRQLPQSLLPNAGPRRPSQEPPRPLRPEDRSRTAMEPPRPMRPEDRSRTMHQLGPNDRNRSRSRDPRDQQQMRPSPNGNGNEYHNQPDIQDSMTHHHDQPPSTPLPSETEFPRSPLQPLSPLQLKNTDGENPTKKPSAPKGNCRGCDQPIQGKSISSSDGRLTGRYHKACFVCHTCKEPFSSSEFYVWENRPYCGRHYHQLNGSLCRMCNNGIEGECLETEGNERYHPGCFTCTDCQRPLGDDYYDLGGKPFCDAHALQRMQQRQRQGGAGRYNGAQMEKRRTRMMMM